MTSKNLEVIFYFNMKFENNFAHNIFANLKMGGIKSE